MGWVWGASGYIWAGLAAAAVPIIVHWLRRRQRRRVRWGPMEMLRPTVARKRRHWQLRDVLLLITRVAAMLGLGLALARPARFGYSAAAAGADHNTAIVVVDNSFSMTHTRLGQRTWDRVPALLDQLAANLPSGTRVAIVPSCGPAGTPWTPVFETPQAAIDRLNDLEPLDQAVDVTRMMSQLSDMVRQLPTPPGIIYWITDHQRRNVAGVSMPSDALPPLRVIPVTEPARSNLWIEDLRVTPDLVLVGDTVEVRVQVGGMGSDVAPQVPVTLWMDDQRIATQLCPRPAEGQWAYVTFQVTIERRPAAAAGGAGDGVLLRAEIPHDALPGDDQRATVVPVSESAPMLLLTSATRRPEVATGAASHYLREYWRSISPAAGANLAEETPLSELSPQQLRGRRLVVLVATTPPSPGQTRALRDFVQRGGQLWISPGEGFDASAWNQAVWNDGDGILPARLREQPLGSRSIESLTVDSIERIDPASVPIELMGSLPGVSDETLRNLYGEIVLFTAVGLDVNANATPRESPDTAGAVGGPGCQVLARTRRGDVVAAYRRLGRGGVMFWGTGLQPTWNNIAGSNAVICWEHWSRFLLRQGRSRHVFTTDEVPLLTVPDLEGNWDWQLIGAADRQPIEVGLRTTRDGEGTRIELDRRLDREGYLLEGRGRGGDRRITLPIAVAPPPAAWDATESNLATVDAVAWNELAQHSGDTQRGGPKRLSVGGVEPDSAWRWWLTLVLACLAVETFLCWRLRLDQRGELRSSAA